MGRSKKAKLRKQIKDLKREIDSVPDQISAEAEKVRKAASLGEPYPKAELDDLKFRKRQRLRGELKTAIAALKREREKGRSSHEINRE